MTGAAKQAVSRGSERVVFGVACSVVYTKGAVFRKSVFVQKRGGFASIRLMCERIEREKTCTLWTENPTFGLFFAFGDSICESAAFLPLFHALCPFANLYYVVAETPKFAGDTAVLRGWCRWH